MNIFKKNKDKNNNLEDELDDDMFQVVEIDKETDDENSNNENLIDKKDFIEENKFEQPLNSEENKINSENDISKEDISQDLDNISKNVEVVNQEEAINQDVKKESKIVLGFLSHHKKTSGESNNSEQQKEDFEEKKKFNFGDSLKKVKSLTEKAVNNIENSISGIGDKHIEREKIKEMNGDFYNKLERLDRKFNELKLIIDDIDLESTKSTKVDVVLSENLSIDSLISKMEQSNNFMKQIAYYLKNEVNNIVANYIEENMSSVIQKVKYLKLEELNAQNKYNITLSDLEEKITGKKKEIIILEKNIEEKKQSISDLEKQIENENETYKNIAEENNRQNIALSELRKNVEEEKKRTLGNLAKYREEEKIKVDTEINKYKEDAKNEIKEGIELELEIQIEEKLKDFENMFKDLSSEVKEQILKKLLNK